MALRDWRPFSTTTRSAPASPPALAAALADLERLTAARPEIAGAGRALSAILEAAFSPPVVEVVFEADPELLVAGWRAGIPAYRVGDRPPSFDPGDLRSRGLAIVAALPPDNPNARPLNLALRGGHADLAAWAGAIVGDRAEIVDQGAEALGLDAALVRSVLRLTLLPALDDLARRLTALRGGIAWTQGDCPFCSGVPTLAESRGLEQRRHWRCGLCASDWTGDRLRCPYCGESDHRRLSYLCFEGEQDRFRLSRCESCGGTLKVVSTLTALSAPGLLVAELATAHVEGLASRRHDG